MVRHGWLWISDDSVTIRVIGTYVCVAKGGCIVRPAPRCYLDIWGVGGFGRVEPFSWRIS